MSLDDQFNKLADEWESYCSQLQIQLSCDPTSRTKCESYREIVSLGIPALQLLKKRYQGRNTEVGIAWINAVQEIVKNSGSRFETPEDLWCNPSLIKEYAINWLEKNIQSYTRGQERIKINVQ